MDSLVKMRRPLLKSKSRHDNRAGRKRETGILTGAGRLKRRAAGGAACLRNFAARGGFSLRPGRVGMVPEAGRRNRLPEPRAG